MDDVIAQILHVDGFTLTVIAVMSFLAALIIKTMTDSLTIAGTFMPFIYLGGLIGLYGCRELEIVFSYSHDSNIIQAAGVGMILAMILLLIATRVSYKVSSWRIFKQLARRGMNVVAKDA